MIKYKIYVVFLLFLSICAFGFVRASDNDLPLLGKVIYIDAGHGRYCYSTQWIKTIRASWFTRKLNFKEIFEKVSLFAYLKRGGELYELCNI